MNDKTLQEYKEYDLFYTLRKTYRKVHKLCDSYLKPLNINVNQLSILIGIKMYGHISSTGVANFLGVDRTTLCRNILPLKKKGLIENFETEDRRVSGIKLLPAGEKLLKDAGPIWLEYHKFISDEYNLIFMDEDPYLDLLDKLDVVQGLGGTE